MTSTTHTRIFNLLTSRVDPEYHIRRSKDSKGEWHIDKTIIGYRVVLISGLSFILGPDDADFARVGEPITLTLSNKSPRPAARSEDK